MLYWRYCTIRTVSLHIIYVICLQHTHVLVISVACFIWQIYEILLGVPNYFLNLGRKSLAKRRIWKPPWLGWSIRATEHKRPRHFVKLRSCRAAGSDGSDGLGVSQVSRLISIYIYIYMHSCSSMVSCSCSFEMTQHRVHTYATTLIGIERSPKPGSKSHISKLFAFNLRLFLKTEKGKPQARSLSVF